MASRPTKHITNETFRLETQPVDLKPGTGESLVRVDYISLDPAMRGWITDVPSYLPPVQIGERMRAAGLGTVIEVGENSKFSVGDLVTGICGT